MGGGGVCVQARSSSITVMVATVEVFIREGERERDRVWWSKE